MINDQGLSKIDKLSQIIHLNTKKHTEKQLNPSLNNKTGSSEPPSTKF
jgi:hypothetical protein